MAVGVGSEETADPPRLLGDGIDDGVAALHRGLVRRVEIIHLDGDVRYYGRMSVVRHDADLQLTDPSAKPTSRSTRDP